MTLVVDRRCRVEDTEPGASRSHVGRGGERRQRAGDTGTEEVREDDRDGGDRGGRGGDSERERDVEKGRGRDSDM